MSDIWDEAPEGAEYNYKGDWYKVVNNVLFTYKVHGASGGGVVPFYWSKSKYVHQLTEKIISKPVAVPKFTKEMADAGTLPSVGMECLINLSHQDDTCFNKGYINGYSQDGKWLVFTDHLGNLEQHNIDNGVYRFKPLTPPIELIDGERYQFDYSDDETELRNELGWYNRDEHSFNVLHDNFSAQCCTNIQLLEVKS